MIGEGGHGTRFDTDPVGSWSDRQVAVSETVGNAMTVDVEDYFQVEAFSNLIGRDQWKNYDCRIERNIHAILQMFRSVNAKATFFTLAWIAERYPSLIQQIVREGHEIASHGLEHRRVDSQTRAEFLDDLTRSKSLLEDIGGAEVRGYRAASFSITRKNLWALEVIGEAGYAYSSSIYPIHHDLYGIPDAPRFAFRPFGNSDFLEIPITSFRAGRVNLPCGGGGYFRLLPYWWSEFQLKRIRSIDHRPCMFYFHPWEIDPSQPRVRGVSVKTRVRHYTNLGSMQSRLEKLLKAFEWRRLDDVYPVKSKTLLSQ